MSYAFFSDTYTPRPDGVAHSVAWSAQALRDLGEKVIVVRPDNGNLPQAEHELALPSNRFPCRDYSVSWPCYFRSAKEWFERSAAGYEKIDVIHVHSLGPIGMLGLRCAWSNAIPAVLSWHTDLLSYAKVYPEVYLGALAARLQMVMFSPAQRSLLRGGSLSETIRKMLRSVDRVVAPSAKTVDQLSLLCPEARISLVPTGLPDYVFRYKNFTSTRMRDQLGIGADDKLVLSVGRLSIEKNPDLLISAFRAIRSSRPRVKCLAVGDPASNRKGYKWKRALRDTGAISLPSMRHTELLELYRAADLLLVTSSTETQGLTALEAHVVGLPVICADPALAMFGDTSIAGVLVVKSATSEDIADASINVLDKLSTRQIRMECADNDCAALSSRAQAMKLMELYEELC